MDRRERLLTGAHGFDLDWWIFSISFSVLALRDIGRPRWLAKLLCRLGKHAWWLTEWAAGTGNSKYTCGKCGLVKQY